VTGGRDRAARPPGLTAGSAPAGLAPLPAKILACRKLDGADGQLLGALRLDPDAHASLGLVTCDADDALYVALDRATKEAEVEVVFARSFYAGSRHASGPFSGEALGIVGGRHPDAVAEALWSIRSSLQADVCFHTFADASGAARSGQPAFFAHVVSETGRWLSAQAGVPAGDPLAYLIAPPLESLVGLDAALKAARVRLVKHFPPPTETNFGGGYLAGDLAEVQAATLAFVEAIRSVAGSPLAALQRPERLRR
jgi:ethanolamine utilization protein EutL